MSNLKKNINNKNTETKEEYTKPKLIKFKKLRKISAKMPGGD